MLFDVKLYYLMKILFKSLKKKLKSNAYVWFVFF